MKYLTRRQNLVHIKSVLVHETVFVKKILQNDPTAMFNMTILSMLRNQGLVCYHLIEKEVWLVARYVAICLILATHGQVAKFKDRLLECC